MGWKVTDPDGNWTDGETLGKDAEIPADKYGEVTLQAQWKQLFGSLTVSVAQMKETRQSFVLTLSGTNVNTECVKITVALNPGESVTIPHLPYGTYKVTDDANWSWRYSGATEDVSLYKETGTAVTLDYSAKRINRFWLNGLGKGGRKR